MYIATPSLFVYLNPLRHCLLRSARGKNEQLIFFILLSFFPTNTLLFDEVAQPSVS